MENKFWFDDKINRSILHDSMQLDSGQTVASLETDKYLVTLEVRGYVHVNYNPDPNGFAEDGNTYKHASAFPNELLDIFAKGVDYSEMKNIDVIDNNWFELFIFRRNLENPKSWTWTGESEIAGDIEDFSDESLKTVLADYLKEFLNSYNAN